MVISDISSGLVIGLPVMLTLGPISLLLLNQGIERGVRSAIPGALGVATADLTYSGLAAAAGTALVAVLNPVAPLLRGVGIVVLLWMAWRLSLDSRREVASLKNDPGRHRATADLSPSLATSDVALEAGESTEPGSAEPGSAEPGGTEVGTTLTVRPVAPGDLGQRGSGPFAHLDGARLGAAFYGLTLMNPMTIVLLSAVVVAGGPGIGTAGWAVGMTLSSLTAHCGYVVVGAVIRRSCSEMTLARMGMVSAVVLVGLSVHLGLT